MAENRSLGAGPIGHRAMQQQVDGRQWPCTALKISIWPLDMCKCRFIRLLRSAVQHSQNLLFA